MSTICFYAQFTKTLVGVNSLTVTWDVERITRSDGTRSALVTAGANGVTVGRRGLYGYVLTSADLSLYDYVATAITAGDVDQQEIAAMWTYWGEATLTAAQILTTALVESYAADNVAPTLTQALFAIQQFLEERSISGTTCTVKKIDGSTTAMTFTLSDATSPTSITRAT